MGWGKRRLPPTIDLPPKKALGMNVHNLTPEHLVWCAARNIRQLRTTLYGDSLGRYDSVTVDRVRTAARDFDVLVVLHGEPMEWPRMASWFPTTVTFQLGNECEAVITPDEYVARWRAMPVGWRYVTAAVGGEPAALYADALVDAGLRPHAFAVHAYGPPPSLAVTQRLRAMMPHVPVWVTEFGIAPKDIRRAWPTDDPANDAARIAAEYAAAAASAEAADRAYLYCLDREDPYGILGTPTDDWLARRA